MEKMTLGKELGILFNLIFNNSISIVALFILIALAVIFISTNKKTAKITKKIYFAIYTGILVFVLITYNKYILDFLDYMMNNLFIAIYFPNLAIYFAAIIISNIIVLISIFNFKVSKIIKNINIVMYTIINFLLVLLIGVIIDKKLDIYSIASVYNNKEAHALVELTSILFILWVVFLIIYKCIRIYQTAKYGERENVKIVQKEKVIEKPVVKKQIVKERLLPDNIVEVAIPNFARQGGLEIKLDENELEYRANIEVEKRVNTKIREAHVFDNMLTKNDYVVLLNLLRQHKERPLERLGEDKVEEDETVETITEEEIETTTEQTTVAEETTEKEIEKTTEEVEEETNTEYYEEPMVIKVIDDDQSSYIRLQELYESVNL